MIRLAAALYLAAKLGPHLLAAPWLLGAVILATVIWVLRS